MTTITRAETTKKPTFEITSRLRQVLCMVGAAGVVCGPRRMDGKMRQVAVNPALADSLFAKPSGV